MPCLSLYLLCTFQLCMSILLDVEQHIYMMSRSSSLPVFCNMTIFLKNRVRNLESLNETEGAFGISLCIQVKAMYIFIINSPHANPAPCCSSKTAGGKAVTLLPSPFFLLPTCSFSLLFTCHTDSYIFVPGSVSQALFCSVGWCGLLTCHCCLAIKRNK